MFNVRIGNVLMMLNTNSNYPVTDYDSLNYLVNNGFVIEYNGAHRLTSKGILLLNNYIKHNIVDLCNYAVSKENNEFNVDMEQAKRIMGKCR